MATAFDLGDTEGGIHPRDKQDLATRLVYSALLTAYQRNEYLGDLGPVIKHGSAALVRVMAYVSVHLRVITCGYIEIILRFHVLTSVMPLSE